MRGEEDGLVKGTVVGGQTKDLFVVHERQADPVQPPAPSQHVFSNRGIGEKIYRLVHFDSQCRNGQFVSVGNKGAGDGAKLLA